VDFTPADIGWFGRQCLHPTAKESGLQTISVVHKSLLARMRDDFGLNPVFAHEIEAVDGVLQLFRQGILLKFAIFTPLNR
jgi:hypothetical protein